MFTLMTVGSIIFVVSIIGFIINFMSAFKNVSEFNENGFMKNMGLHLLFGLGSSAGFIMLVAGFVWYLVHNYS